MSPIIIESLDDERVAPFARLTEAQLRSRLDPSQALFIAESPKVIHVALDAGYEALAMLCEEKHISGDAAGIIDRCPQMAVYTASRSLLEKLTGYTLTRGVLCAMRRPAEKTVADVCPSAPARSRVVVIDGVTDTTNIGAIFRSAAALGIDAVLLSPTSCDPLNRRSVRVSMGSVFLVPWAYAAADYQTQLRQLGYKTVAMALTPRSVPMDAPELKAEDRLAIIMGTEGDGLPTKEIEDADYTVRIPMAHGVDSLNVAAAAAVAFWELRL